MNSLEEETQDLTKKVLTTPEEYRIALSQAQIEGVKHLEISEKLFKYFRRNGDASESSFTDGSPGVRIFKEGTREAIEGIESMGAEAHHDYVIRNTPKKIKG